MMQFPKGSLLIFLFFASLLSVNCTLRGENTFTHTFENLPPVALKGIVLSDTIVDLDWLAIDGETEWEVELIRKGNTFSNIPTHTGINIVPFQIDTLSGGVSYEFRVRAVFSGVPGPWSSETGTFFMHILNKNGCGIDLEIPDADCLNPNASIQVRNEVGVSLGSDVILQEIKLIIEHDWLIDLEIWLKSPTGITVQLIDENGGTNNDFGIPSDLTCQNSMSLLNANACGEISLSLASPPFDGRYLPIGNLNDFNDGSNPNGVWDLIICDDAPTNIGSLKFVELVFESVNCTPPTGLIATDTDSTSINLDWAPGGFCGTTIVEYGLPGFGIGNGTSVNAGCPPFNLTGLQGDTEYEIYIYEDCGGGNFAFICESILVTTDCAPPPLTIFSDFDNHPTCFGFSCLSRCDINNDVWQNARNEQIDWSVENQGTLTPGTGPSSDFSGSGNYIYLESTSFGGLCAPGSEAILMSNCMTVDTRNSDTCHVGFRYHMNGVFINDLKFQITTDGIIWTTLWEESGNQGNRWFETRVSLSGYNGQAVQFRFVGRRGNGSAGDIALDEIAFYGSIDNGNPPFVFYADNDGDGFGNSNSFIQQCFNVPPLNFVDNNLDCNDFNPNVALNSPEIPCNGIDENCNGNNDDSLLPTPGVSGITIHCEGERDTLIAFPRSGGEIRWFDSNFFEISMGDTLIVENLPVVNGNPTVYDFFAIEGINNFLFNCESLTAVVEVIVNPKPSIFTTDEPVICRGESFDLSTVQVSDRTNSNEVAISFSTGFPTNQSNSLFSPIVSPVSTQEFFIRKITSGGCFDSTSVTVEVLPSPIATITPSQDTLNLCRGDARILLGNSSGGMGNLNQIWSNLQTSSNIFVNSGANNGDENLMTFTVTDENQCSDTDSILIRTITNVEEVEISNISPVSFCFGNDGAITLNPSGGIPNYNYSWSGPVSGSASANGGFTIANLIQGSYSISITDASSDGCEFVLRNIVVDGPSANISVDSIRPVSCNGEIDGGIFTTISGNNPSIIWSPNIGNTDDITGLQAGSYSVTVSDGVCETIITNIEIPEPDNLVALSNPVNVSCFSETNGGIEVSIFGGKPNYNIEWNDGNLNQNRSGLGMGDFWFTLTDRNGCTFDSDTITISQPPEIMIAVDRQSNPLCNGELNGEISVSASGGTPPFQYFWDDGAVGDTRVGLAADTYNLSVMDANGCMKQMAVPVILADPNPVRVTRAFINNATCFGIPNGGIDINVVGGTGDYDYTWNTNSVTQDISNIQAGEYWVTIEDSNGCTIVSDTIIVDAPESLDVNFDIQSPTCIGKNDGAIDLEINNGGAAPFDYAWSNTDSIQDLNNIEPGNYEVTISHDDGCISIFRGIEVTAVQVLDGDNLNTLSPNCHGESTGRIFSNIRDGQRPYSYDWSNGDTTQNLIEIPSGNYSLIVTDANDCKLTIDSIEVVDNDSLLVEVLGIDQVSCYNDTTGSISVRVTGGIPGYDLSWNGGIFSDSTLTNLSAGSYNLTVSDDANCVIEFPTITLENPPEIMADFQVCLDPDCTNGLNRDTIKLFTSGGVPNFSYLWSNNSTDSQLTNISDGEFDVTITDMAGCQKIIEDIKVPSTASNFLISDIERENVSCFGGEDGSISVSFEGGTAPYRFLWSDRNGTNGITMDTVLTITNEEEGLFSVTVIDANGCIIESPIIEITEPDPIIFEILNTESVTCFGGSNGSITSRVQGGNPPFDFLWIDAQDSLRITGNESANIFPAGEYLLAVTDQLGCTFISPSPIIITQPDSFFVALIDSTNVSCQNDSSGMLEIDIQGGNPDYFVIWEDGVRNQRVRDSLVAGSYPITIRDDLGCILLDTFNISQPSSSMFFTDIESFIPICNGDNSGIIDFDVFGGTPPYLYFRDGVLLDSSLTTNLFAGTYEIQVRDLNLCLVDTTLTIVDPPFFDLTFTSTPVTPNIWNDGTITANPNGGVPPFTYLWNTGDTTARLSNLMAGNYIVIVTDSNGCTLERAHQIDILSSVSELEIDGNISIAPNPTSGVANINFELSNFENFEYLLIDNQGKLLLKDEIDIPFSTTLPLDLRGYPDGIYYFILQKENAWKSWKILKQR